MIIIIALVGLLLGSFINAAVWRLHQRASRKSKVESRKLSILSGRSICPHCRHQLAAIDLIPVLSWLMLGGRCRYCGQPISLQYPIVELLTALLFVVSLLAWDFQAQAGLTSFVIWLAVLAGLVALAVYDLLWMLLPDRIVLPVIGLAVLRLGVLAVAAEPTAVFTYLLAALLAGGFFYVLFALGRGKWMGGGDVKLAFLMGLLLGTSRVLVALVLAFNAAALLGVGLIMLHRASRKSLLPFGPFLIAGTIVAALYGQSLIDLYLKLVHIY